MSRLKQLENLAMNNASEVDRLRSVCGEMAKALEKIDAMPHYDFPVNPNFVGSLHGRYELALELSAAALSSYNAAKVHTK